MDRRSLLTQFLVAAAVFCVVDLIWLGLVANDLYRSVLGDLLREEPNIAAAAVFYALFVAGLVHFVIAPAVAAESPRQALLNGAFFGLVTYATWDLTSLAVLADFPLAIVPIDLAWGSVLGATVSAVTVAVCLRLSARVSAAR